MRKQMEFRTNLAAVGKASMMALLMAVAALWATFGIAGMNEDLFEASKRGDLPEVKRLIAKGADVNAKNEIGWTALMSGSLRGHPEVVKELLAKGAEVNTKDRFGKTALWGASSGGHLKIVQVLLAKGADVNAKDKLGRTALGLASMGGNPEIVRALLAKGAEVNAKDKLGRTVLGLASMGGNPEIVRALLAKGAEVNAKRKDGSTALMAASAKGNREVVQLLLDKGADVNAMSKDGRTAFGVASTFGHREIRELLIKAGARRKSDALKFRLLDWWEAYAPKLPLNMVMASLAILLAGGLWLWRTWRARVSEPDVGPQPDYLSSPPSDLPPAMVFLVRKSRLEYDDNAQLIMATLIDLVQKGFLEIEFEETPVIVGHHIRKDLLIRKGKGDPKYEFEKLVISHFAGHKLYGQAKGVGFYEFQKSLKRESMRRHKLYDQAKHVGFYEFQKSLERESVSIGFFEEESTKAQKRARKTGLVILGTAFAAFLLMLFSGGLFFSKDPMFWGVILPVLAFLTLAFIVGVFVALALLLGPKKRKRTWQGVREVALWSAFCSHLRKVLLQRDLAGNYIVTMPHLDLWETYLPYVIIFGYLTHWRNRFVEMHAPVPYWFYTPVSHGPTAKSGGEPLTPDSVRQAFEDMVSSIYDTITSTWPEGGPAF